MLKLNLGSGKIRKKEGWTNVDIQDWEGNTDIKHDLTCFPYPFNSESIEEIYSAEFLEHISFKNTKKFLDECWRILKYEGSLTIQVPDAGKAMEYYTNKQICDCVKHKPTDEKDAIANPYCVKCKGRAKINPIRWLYTFTGACKHQYDYHLNIFTKESLLGYLENSFFRDIEIKNDNYGWKLIAKCKK